MCTVSYIPVNDAAIITSNRDEKLLRAATKPPFSWQHLNNNFIAPQDEKASGTWIGMNNCGHIAVLLNGAFEKHISTNNYRHSRGIIIPQLLNSLTPSLVLENLNLKEIEPFTVILLLSNKLFEYRWDGVCLHSKKLNTQQAYLWSSCTLYNNEICVGRNNEFAQMFQEGKLSTPNSILHYHHQKKYETTWPQVASSNNINTISITQIVQQKTQSIISYSNLINQQHLKQTIMLNPISLV